MSRWNISWRADTESPLMVSELLAMSYICRRWMPVKKTVARTPAVNAPLIMMIVEVKTLTYLGDATCSFIMVLSVWRARHVATLTGIDMPIRYRV